MTTMRATGQSLARATAANQGGSYLQFARSGPDNPVVRGGKRLRNVTLLFAGLCLLELALHNWPRATADAAWTMLGLAWMLQDRRRPEPDRFDPEATARGARRAALCFAVASTIWLGWATLLPGHPTRGLVQSALSALLGGLCLWSASYWTTPRGQLRLERLRQRDALKKGSTAGPATTAAAGPVGHADTTWQAPPYFSS
jgi:hypothetical protein